MPAIDLNCELGGPYDEAMLGVVTSADVACGFHAGTPSTLRRVCAMAAECGVVIGAQVSYPDPAGSGQPLRDAVLYQLGGLDGFAQVAGAGVGYLTPDGALRHACATDHRQAEAVATAAHEYDPAMAVLAPAGSPLLAIAHALGMEAVPEAFADRAYLADGSLVPCAESGAVLLDPPTVGARAVRMVCDGTVDAADGTEIAVVARSLCIRGGTQEAVAQARAVRDALEDAGVAIHPFGL